jgi:serine/threonine protein kinase
MNIDKDTIINNKYKVIKCVGKGSFGDVYIGYDQVDKHLVAIKVSDKTKRHILKHEYQIYMDLMTCSKPPLIPNIYWFGDYNDNAIMTMKFLGNSLEYLLHTCCAGKFSVKTTLMVSIQIFDLLMRLHSCGYIHRDIKPDNFLVGIGPERSQIYLIDLGLAKRYKLKHVHIKEADDKKLTGTARYTSINSHQKMEQSRRDDLESLGYLMIYFLKGKLPWQGIIAANKDEKYEKIGHMKAAYELNILCTGAPIEIYNFLAHVRSLSFKEKPNYHYLRSLLINAFNRLGYDYNYRYDWEERCNQAQSFDLEPNMGAYH